jgi:hypothetical protein
MRRLAASCNGVILQIDGSWNSKIDAFAKFVFLPVFFVLLANKKEFGGYSQKAKGYNFRHKGTAFQRFLSSFSFFMKKK